MVLSKVLILTVFFAIMLITIVVFQQNKLNSILKQNLRNQANSEERENLIKKEALITARETLQEEYEKQNNEIRERRQELSKLENKLSERQDALDEKIQENVDKEVSLQKKQEELLDRQTYLNELIDSSS